MNNQILPAIKECIEYIEQENAEISLGDESIAPFIIKKIVVEEYHPAGNWEVVAYDTAGRKYKYAWYISESGMITADGS